jgi:mRNA interferase MazF
LWSLTTSHFPDGYSIELHDADFSSGGLRQTSRIRPNRLFTADAGIILYRAGHISDLKLNQALNALVGLLKPATS